MSDVKFTLIHGLKLGDEPLKNVVLRELTSGDIFAASEESEKLVKVGEGKNASYEFITSPTLMSKETLRRQIKSIDDVSGPLSVKALESIHPEDLSLLEEWSLVLEGTITPAEVGQRGRSDTPAPGA